MRVIGTAGHVDHGKSTLVQALTGTHPDRLKEEREREMTIDLGFAWLTLPDGEDVGIVDVPGHRDFIENMLAGIGGIDAVLFVIAADEGIMPQTREHLAILDILQIQSGVIVLTKIDLIEDPDWLELVEDDIRSTLRGTILEAAPLIRVSARRRTGVENLLQALSSCLAERPPRPDLGRPRLPVDRVFTMPGFGTVVTGTLTDGQLSLGDELEILPAGLRGRVRGLQTHRKKEEIAVPGSRTAINISGIDLEEVRRGVVVTHPGDYHTSRRIDVQFRLLKDVSQPLEHNTQVKLFVGAAEIQARLRLLGSERLNPGDEGWLQLELSQDVVVVRGDRYILRRPSPGETLGGGKIVDPHPKRRHKRYADEVLRRLESLAQGDPADVLRLALQVRGIAPLREVIAHSHLDDHIASKVVDDMLVTGEIVRLEDQVDTKTLSMNSLVTHLATWQRLAAQAMKEVESYHRQHPLRRGLPREELKSRLKLTSTGMSARLFSAALRKMSAEGLIVEAGPLVKQPDHTIKFNPQQQRQVDTLLHRFAEAPYTPPTVKDCIAEVGEELFNALLELGELVSISPDVVFRYLDYEKMVADIRSLLNTQGTLTAAEGRDYFNTSRRYILALLEHLDAIGVTKREGDLRRLNK